MQMCATQGRKGELTPVKVSAFGLGGAVSINTTVMVVVNMRHEA